MGAGLTPAFPTAESRSTWPSHFRGLRRVVSGGRPVIEVTVTEGAGDIDGDPVWECTYVYDAITGEFIDRDELDETIGRRPHPNLWSRAY